jgi:hypothetical protein
MTPDESLVVFISCVTNEFGRYRSVIRDCLKRVSLGVVIQEDFEYAQVDVITKLYRKISKCEVVIHFVGQGAGTKAADAAVKEFLDSFPGGREAFLALAEQRHLSVEQLYNLTYTQWEALIALCFPDKHFMPIRPACAIPDGHPDEKEPFLASAFDKQSQVQHMEWLEQQVRKKPQVFGEAEDVSFLEDAFHKIQGFLNREYGTHYGLQQAEIIRGAHERFGRGALGKLVQLLTQTHRESLRVNEFLPAATVQIVGDQFASVLFGDAGRPKGDLLTLCIERLAEYQIRGAGDQNEGIEQLVVLALSTLKWAETLKCDMAVLDLKKWVAQVCSELNLESSSFQPKVNHVFAAWEGAVVPKPIIQAGIAKGNAAKLEVEREARILWGQVTQVLNLNDRKSGPVVDTIGVVEDAVYDLSLQTLPYKCLELSIRKEDTFSDAWFDRYKPGPWARVLRIQRKPRELAEANEPQFPLMKDQIACCRSHANLADAAENHTAFLATWCECEPNWRSLSDAARNYKIGFWFPYSQTTETTDRVLDRLENVSSFDDAIERVRILQKGQPSFRTLLEHPHHEPYAPASHLESNATSQYDTVAYLS